MFTLPVGFMSSGVPFLTYSHTWVGDADIQGNKADFDGAGDALTIPDTASLELGSDDFTVEVILTVDAEPQALPGIIGKWSGVSPDIGWLLYWDVGTQTVRFLYSVNGTTLTSIIGTAITLGVESHIAASRSGSTIRLFIDGVLAASDTIGIESIHDNGLLITQGAFEEGTGGFHANSYLDGTINYSKISNVALYTTGFTAPTELSNDINTIYLNSFNGANGSTPTLNTE